MELAYYQKSKTYGLSEEELVILNEYRRRYGLSVV